MELSFRALPQLLLLYILPSSTKMVTLITNLFNSGIIRVGWNHVFRPLR